MGKKRSGHSSRLDKESTESLLETANVSIKGSLNEIKEKKKDNESVDKAIEKVH